METTTETTECPAAEPVDPRIRALAKHLGLDNDGLDEIGDEDDNRFSYGRERYIVLTDEEADDEAKDRIKETLWAFNTSFLAHYVPALYNPRAATAWEKMVGTLCDDANPLVEAMLAHRFHDFLDAAISADGRGHFLAGYDDAEYDEKIGDVTYYIYRTD